MVSHAQAREWAAAGTASVLGDKATLAHVQFVQAIALGESGYGQGWGEAGDGSFNMGAVQAGHPPCNPNTSFQYQDSHPNPDGTSTKYTICFKRYDSPVEGMADVARIIYKQDGCVPTSIRAVAECMYAHHYYEGFGKTKEDRINGEIKALTKNLTAITSKLGEAMPPADDGVSATGGGLIMGGLALAAVLGVVLVTR